LSFSSLDHPLKLRLNQVALSLIWAEVEKWVRMEGAQRWQEIVFVQYLF
jgi:hypothetical protein